MAHIPHGTIVKIRNTGIQSVDGLIGRIVGIASIGIPKVYIILFDEIRDALDFNWSALSLPESKFEIIKHA